MPIWNDEKKVFEVKQDEFYNQLYKHHEPSKLTLEMFNEVKNDIKKLSKNKMSGLTIGKYLIFLAIEIGILTSIFRFVFYNIDNVTNKCDAHINTHFELIEELSALRTDISWIKNEMINKNNK